MYSNLNSKLLPGKSTQKVNKQKNHCKNLGFGTVFCMSWTRSKTSSLHGFTIYFFSLLETSCEQDDNFPSSVCVKVNGRLQTLPNPIPTNKPGVEPKRPPKPIDITALCKLSSTVPNFVNVTWAVEVRIYILKVRNSTNYGCFANYQSQNITKYFPFISLSRTC